MKVKKFLSKKTMKTAMTIFSILAFVVVVGFLFKYNNDKNMLINNMQSMSPSEVISNVPDGNVKDTVMNNGVNNSNGGAVESVSGHLSPEVSNFLPVDGMETSKSGKMSCNNQPVMDPKELLPLDSNKEWNNIKPNSDLKQLNLVNAGHHIGINTVSSSLRNPNLQIRSEPSIPKGNVGPWNNTTIEGDPHRKGFELA
tara:strand:+ start:438 stop:1031 length:594 start_codon:yes stop_codon:yes gene_type:complete